MGVVEDAKEAAKLECEMEKLETEFRSLMEEGGSEADMASAKKKGEELGEKYKKMKERLQEQYKDDENAQKEFYQALKEAKEKCGS